MRRTWTMTIHGPPRTKKTANEIHLTVNKDHLYTWVASLQRHTNPATLMRAILSKVRVQPNKRWRQWAKKAPITVQADGFRGDLLQPDKYPITAPIHVTAVFYRERAAGDLLGYEQGLADLLEQRQIIKNDRQLVNWDGSRLDKDKERPRVEFTLLEVGDVPRETKGEDDDTQRDLELDRGESGAEATGATGSADDTPEGKA